MFAGSDLDDELLREGVPGVQQVVQSPLDRVVHGVQLISSHVTVLETLGPPQQDGQRPGHRKAELDVVTRCNECSGEYSLPAVTRWIKQSATDQMQRVVERNEVESTRACVRACVRVCVRACVYVCMCVCVCVCVCEILWLM